MALYDVEILESTSNPRALKLICTIAGINERDIKTRLQFVPFVVKGRIPLSEAIEIDRQLKRFGIKTHLVRVDTADAEPVDSDEEPEPDSSEEPIPVVQPEIEDVIEIPENEVKVLLPQELDDSVSKFERRKVKSPRGWMGRTAVAAVFLGIVLVTWYVTEMSSKRQTEVEINLYISQWQDALMQQDLYMDKGLPPERIFYKLDEIDAKINRLLVTYRPAHKSTQMRADFKQAKSESRHLVMDLAFRRALEDSGYPIHPMCIVDRGMVRGSSELPEATLLRIQLLGEDDLESVYYASRISGGAFKLIIDPSIETGIYDATATVASFAQQPKEIQRWAERKFGLEKFCDEYLPKPPRPTRLAETSTADLEAPLPPIAEGSAGQSTSTAYVSLADPGSDAARSRELEGTLTSWTETILSSQKDSLEAAPETLEQIYHRLLDLEVRVDQLIGLLESSIDQNVWIERREEVYGSFINTRRKINELYETEKRTINPFKMERALRRQLQSAGFPHAEVLVIDSPEVPGAFVIEIEIYEGNKEDILLAVAEKVSAEMQDTRLRIERVRLRIAGETLRWDTEQIVEAAEDLESEEGRKRCISKMELSAITHATP